MTKKELIFSVMNDVRGQAITQDSLKFTHPQDVEFELAKAYDSVVVNFFNDPAISTSYDLDYFCKSYNETLRETALGDLYVSLPVKPLSLKDGLGVLLVKPKDSDVLISRITESEYMSLKDLEAFCCSPVPFCYVDNSNNRIILQSNRSEYRLMEQITIKIVPKFTSFGYNDEINTPGGEFQLAQMVMELMGIRPTDNSNDDLR